MTVHLLVACCSLPSVEGAYREWIAAVDFLLALLGGGLLEKKRKTALWCSRAWLSGSACRVSYVVNERVRSVVSPTHACCAIIIAFQCSRMVVMSDHEPIFWRQL